MATYDSPSARLLKDILRNSRVVWNSADGWSDDGPSGIEMIEHDQWADERED